MISIIIGLIILMIVVFILIPDVILIFVLSQLLFFTIYFTIAEFYFLFTTIVFLLYIGLKYNDGDEYTGARTWNWLRKFTFNRSIDYEFVDKDGYIEQERILFVVVGNITNFSLISAFGLHGGIFNNAEINYILPPILFKIPILKDILLWTGAVTYQGTDSVDTVLKLLKRNKSIAYCPANMDDLLAYTSTDCEQVTLQNPSIDVFEFAMRHKIKIAPVLIQGETERYSIRKNKYINKAQRYCMQQTRFRWPFPFWFGIKIFGKNPPPKVKMYIGPIMNPSVYDSAELFSNSFMKKLEEQYSRYNKNSNI
jgi:hypothetical protein